MDPQMGVQFFEARSYDPVAVMFIIGVGLFLLGMIMTIVFLVLDARKRKQYESGDRQTKQSIEQQLANISLRLVGVEKRMTAIETLLIEEDRNARQETCQDVSGMR